MRHKTLGNSPKKNVSKKPIFRKTMFSLKKKLVLSFHTDVFSTTFCGMFHQGALPLLLHWSDSGRVFGSRIQHQRCAYIRYTYTKAEYSACLSKIRQDTVTICQRNITKNILTTPLHTNRLPKLSHRTHFTKGHLPDDIGNSQEIVTQTS